MRAGLKVEQEVIGDGPVAEVGDRVTVRLEIRLNRGELVQSLDAYTFVIGTYTAGQKVYATNDGIVTEVPDGSVFLGKVVDDAEPTDDVVRVRLSQ